MSRNGSTAGLAIARWLDDRAAAVAADARVRLGLLRLAVSRRGNIPGLAVLALELQQRAPQDPEPHEFDRIGAPGGKHRPVPLARDRRASPCGRARLSGAEREAGR